MKFHQLLIIPFLLFACGDNEEAMTILDSPTEYCVSGDAHAEPECTRLELLDPAKHFAAIRGRWTAVATLVLNTPANDKCGEFSANNAFSDFRLDSTALVRNRAGKETVRSFSITPIGNGLVLAILDVRRSCGSWNSGISFVCYNLVCSYEIPCDGEIGSYVRTVDGKPAN